MSPHTPAGSSPCPATPLGLQPPIAPDGCAAAKSAVYRSGREQERHLEGKVSGGKPNALDIKMME